MSPPASSHQSAPKKRTKSLRPPRRAAVKLTTANGNSTKYSNLLKETRAVKLSEIGIDDIRCRRAITSGVILEIPRKESAAKAETLASRLKAVFHGRNDVKINRLRSDS